MLIEITAVLTILWLAIMHRYLRPARIVIRTRQGR